jgi:hypothetical protein
MSPADAAERLIFVGGAPRSGTTLLQNMLDSHPDIVGAPEFLHLPDIIQLRSVLHESLEEGRIESLCSTERVDELVRDMILDFLLPLADRMKRTYLSEKTPENVLVFSELASLFPESRFLHIVRDPRAIVASMLQVAKRSRAKNLRPPSYTASVSAATAHTKACVSSGFRAAQHLPERIRTIVYERLVANPAEETRRICDFLGIPWARSMLEPGARPHPGEEVMTRKTQEIWYDKTSFSRDPITDRVDQWTRQLTLRDQTEILSAFEGMRELEELGYDLRATTTRLEGPAEP